MADTLDGAEKQLQRATWWSGMGSLHESFAYQGFNVPYMKSLLFSKVGDAPTYLSDLKAMIMLYVMRGTNIRKNLGKI